MVSGVGGDRGGVSLRSVTAPTRTYLFTAFEHSGDAHAAPVISALRGLDPSARIVAWGGERMARAGAEMIGRTAESGAMGLQAISKIFAVRKVADEVEKFARANHVTVHIPVDSPAANFPLCARTKRYGARVVHLVAPQMWAWGPWRIRKLRRLTNHVLCLLPFEEPWFRERGVPATFIGHPVINGTEAAHSASWTPSDAQASGSPRVLLLPGSRTHEVDRNGKLIIECWEAIAARHPGSQAVVCAANDRVLERIESELSGHSRERLTVVTGAIDDAVPWCDFAIAVSGTVSLDLTKARKPMIGVYRATRLGCLGGRFLLTLPNRLLPNILARRRLVPEFVPFAGSSRQVVEAALRMASDLAWRAEMRRGLDGVVQLFEGHDPGPEAARVILGVAAQE